MAYFNIEKWVQFIDSFVGFEQVSIKSLPLITLTMSFKELKKKKKSESKEKLIYFEPNLEEIKAKFSEPINWIIDFLNSIQTLESDFVKILGLPSQQVFNLDKTHGPFAVMMSRLERILESAMERADKIQ